MSRSLNGAGSEEELPRALVTVTVAVNLDSRCSEVRLIPRSR